MSGTPPPRQDPSSDASQTSSQDHEPGIPTHDRPAAASVPAGEEPTAAGPADTSVPSPGPDAPAAFEPPETSAPAAAATEAPGPEAATDLAEGAAPAPDPAPLAASTGAGNGTASAPTPDADMGALLDGAATSVQQVKVGDRVSGVVVRLGDENCFVDFGGRSEGVIRTTELLDEMGKPAYAVGDPVEAFVVADADGVTLSRFVSGEARQADVLYKAFKAGVPVQGRVTAVNKWGLGVDLESLRAFCPVSQIDTRFTEDPEQFRDQTLTFKIIRFRDRGRSIVLSRRALLEAEQEKQADQVRQGIAPGAELTGTVTRLESFGAFVDLGSHVEGLVHVSELRHERVNRPDDVVQPGQEVKVKVLDVKNLGHRRKERISLSMKALESDPWEQIRKEHRVGTVTTGRVEAVEDYGAFVELAPNVRGLVHVSEMADRRVNHPRDVVSVGDEVKVAVLEIDDKRKRLRLSMRRAEKVEGEANLKEFAERQRQEQAATGSANTAMLEALKRAKLVD